MNEGYHPNCTNHSNDANPSASKIFIQDLYIYVIGPFTIKAQLNKPLRRTTKVVAWP